MYLEKKFTFLGLDELEIFDEKIFLSVLALGLLITAPYLNLNIFIPLTIIFVFLATYLGQLEYGFLATLWSLIALSLIDEGTIGLEFRVSYFVTLSFINLGVTTIIKYYLELIKELSQTKSELKESNQQLNREFIKAKRIHKSFLPPAELKDEEFYFNSLYKPAEIIGGDYYNYIELEDKFIGYMAVVTGHSLDGTLINVFVREKINYFLALNSAVGSKKILEFLLKEFRKEDFPADYSLCLTFWVLDKKTSEIHYNNAGNHIPILINQDKNIKQKIEKNPPISTVFSQEDYDFGNNKVKLNQGDRVLFLTDGLIAQQNQEEIYGLDRLKNIFKENIIANDLLQSIYNDFNDFLSVNPQQDDVTMFLITKKNNIF